MSENNNYKMQGYLFLGGIIYFLFLMITTFLDVLEDVRVWSFLGLLIISSLWSISSVLINLSKDVESDRVQNKRNIIHQYFYLVPKNIVLFVLYSIPFLLISGVFFYVIDRTNFYRTFCLPILGGFIGEMIWGFLFFFIYCYVIYLIYKPINRLYYK